ncbi:hypothetical protein AB6G14_05320 [Providencia hangzhouensis]
MESLVLSLFIGGLLFAREANDTAILVEAKGAAGAKVDKTGEKYYYQ